MKDRRTIVMLALLLVVAILGGVYVFADGDGEAAGWAMPAGAILLLLILVGASAGGSRNRRVVRDEEESRENDR